MTDNIVPFEPKKTNTVSSTDDLDPDVVLETAKGHLTKVVVIGFTPDDETYIASSTGYIPDLLYMVEIFKADILEQANVR